MAVSRAGFTLVLTRPVIHRLAYFAKLARGQGQVLKQNRGQDTIDSNIGGYFVLSSSNPINS